LRPPKALILLAVLAAYSMLAARMECSVGAPLQPPSLSHPLGTDPLGYDALCTISKGVLASLEAGAAAALSTAAVILVAASAGVSRVSDRIVTMVSGVALGLPSIALFALLAMIATLEPWQAGLLVGLVAGLQAARSVAARAKSIARMPFVEAAVASGAGRARVLLRHIMPNMLDMLASYSSIGAAAGIYAEAGLSMLGLTDPSTPSLGRVLDLVLNTPGAIMTLAGVLQASVALLLITLVAVAMHEAIRGLLYTPIRETVS